METIHGKSECCRAKIYRFGGKRRQCSLCARTWRIRPQRRGPHRIRLKVEMLENVLLKGGDLSQMAQGLGLSRQALSYRFRQLLKKNIARAVTSSYPEGELILLTDGLWFCFRSCIWVLYLAAVKSGSENRAFFLVPLLLEGKESAQGWQQTIQAIPVQVKERIRAWVCDHFRGAESLAKENGWILQLCHFHLIAQLQARRGHWKKRGIKGRKARQALYQYIREALETADESRLHFLIRRLNLLGNRRFLPAKLRMIVREFTRSVNHFRAYRYYHGLNLPTTTGSIESMGRIIRDLMRQTRNICTPAALHLWVRALLRMRHTITCNGKHFQPK